MSGTVSLGAIKRGTNKKNPGQGGGKEVRGGIELREDEDGSYNQKGQGQPNISSLDELL